MIEMEEKTIEEVLLQRKSLLRAGMDTTDIDIKIVERLEIYDVVHQKLCRIVSENNNQVRK